MIPLATDLNRCATMTHQLNDTTPDFEVGDRVEATDEIRDGTSTSVPVGTRGTVIPQDITEKHGHTYIPVDFDNGVLCRVLSTIIIKID